MINKINTTDTTYLNENKVEKSDKKYYVKLENEYDRYEKKKLNEAERKETDKKFAKKTLAGLYAMYAALSSILLYNVYTEQEGTKQQYQIKNQLQTDELEINGKRYLILDENKKSPFDISVKEGKKYFPLKSNTTKVPVIKEGTMAGVLEGKEKAIEDLCEKYGVEPKFIAALIGAETGWGTTGVSVQNNPMSYRASGDLGKDENGFGIFSTPEAGLEAGISNIADYRNRYGIEAIDIDHADEIGEIYADGDKNWATFVRECYKGI